MGILEEDLAEDFSLTPQRRLLEHSPLRRLMRLHYGFTKRLEPGDFESVYEFRADSGTIQVERVFFESAANVHVRFPESLRPSWIPIYWFGGTGADGKLGQPVNSWLRKTLIGVSLRIEFWNRGLYAVEVSGVLYGNEEA